MIKKTLVVSLLGLALGASAQVTNISALRALVDADYVPTDTNTVFTIQGVVTTHTNMTSSSGTSFYMQDDTAGIAVYKGGSLEVPDAGANVTVSGRLSSFNGLLEIGYDVTIVTNSTGNPLPTPAELDFNQVGNAAYMDALEGSYVVVSNVFFDQTYSTLSGTVTITNQYSQTFVIYANYYTDVAGKPTPTGPATVLGVLGQYDTSSPYIDGYQLIPSRYEDIITPIVAPLVDFTNILSNLVRPGDAPTNSSFTEYALRPGETLTINTLSYDKDGSNITINPVTSGLPATASWNYSSTSGTNVPATFSYTPAAGDAGNAYDVTLIAYSTRGTNTSVWKIYVPTAEEQNIVISEYLAAPTTDTNSIYFNPLHRPPPGSTNAFADDEYVEIVNAGDTAVNLAGWQMADASSLRHTFYYSTPIASSNTAVLYGGPLNNDPAPPSIPGYSEPFSEGVPGQSVLNNGGDTISLYNSSSLLVARVVYTGYPSANGISFTRFPTLTDDFVEHTSVVCTNASPGLQPDQRPYDQPVNFADPPTVTEIADQNIAQDASAGPLAFTVGDPVTPVGNLTLMGMSSNTELVPDDNIVFGGSGSSRTVTVTPVAGLTGVATITISVGNDALRCASTSFVLTVGGGSVGQALFCDDFSYPDGSIITNSSYVWTNHSGTLGQMQVSGGKLQLTYSQSEDVNALIPDVPASGMLYYSFTVNFSDLPGDPGGYFAHFKNIATTFRARLWAQTTGAGSGAFRLGIANTSSSGDVVQFPQDLNLNTTYRVVVGHSLDTGVSTLWVDPASESDAGVETTDGTSPTAIAAMAFREAFGIGILQVDDLCVGTSFDSVVPVAGIPLEHEVMGDNLILTWSDPSFQLQAAPTVSGTYTNVPGATSPYTNAVTGDQMYFRLKN